MSYKVLRSYFDDVNYPQELLAEGLTLDEAQQHCKNPEASSRTCKEPQNVARTERCGRWFDGYEEE